MTKAVQSPFCIGLTKKQVDFVRKKARNMELSMSAYLRKMINVEIAKEAKKNG